MFFSIRMNRVICLLAAVAFLGSLQITATAVQQSGEQETKLPIIMYHSLLKEKKRQGKYVISPKTFESDLKYLQRNGYHTVVVQDLLDYVYRDRPLPVKPVMLTFDDGYYNNYLYAYPLVKQYQAKIIISPIGYYTDLFTEKDADHANYSHLTWAEIQEMSQSGYVEIQNHSYNLHSEKGRIGAQKKWGESSFTYRAILKSDLDKMQKELVENTGKAATAFVYPYGAISKDSVDVIKKMGFLSTMTCLEKVNEIDSDPESLYELGRFLRPGGPSSERYFRKIGLV